MYVFTLMVITLLMPLIMVSTGIKRKTAPYTVILQSVLFTAVTFVLIFGAAWFTGEPFFESILKEIEFSVNQIVQNPELMKALNLSGYEGVEAKNVLMDSYKILISMLPSIIISWSILISYFDYLIISVVLKKLGKDVMAMPSFSTFSLPKKAVYGSLLIYGLSWLAVAMNIMTEDTLLLNVRDLMEFVFAIQGLAVIAFTIKQNKERKIHIVVGVLISILMFTSPLGRSLLAIMGFIDLLVGIRQKMENR